MAAIATLVITAVAFWIAFNRPDAFAQFGFAGVAAWIVVVVLVWTLFILAMIIKSAVASIDRDLRPDIAMTPVAESEVPDALRALAEELTALGLVRVTSPLAVALSNPGVMFGFVERRGNIGASAFTIQPASGAAPVTSFDFVSRFDNDESSLMTSPNPGGAVLPATPGAFRQIFPGGDPATLLQRHREALDWLQAQGLRVQSIRGSEFEHLFRLSMERGRAAFKRARLRFAVTAIWRTISKRSPHTGPVSEQRAARAEIDRVLTRR